MNIKSLLLIIALTATSGILFAQNAPRIVWQKTFGGAGNDSLVAILPTNDGGFIMSGHSNSNAFGDKTQNSYNNTLDYWVIKTNSKGKIQWSRTLGGTGIDNDPVVIQTGDGGFLVGGTSISMLSGDKTEDAINGSNDYWVVKLDKNGVTQWNNTIGSIQRESLNALAQASDGTYRIAGNSWSNFPGDDKRDANRGSSLWPDYWVVKLDKKGKVVWDHCYGGGNEDYLTCLKPTKDSGYIMGGYSYSPAEYEKTDSFIGSNDYWIVKMDKDGNKTFDKTLGGDLSDYQTDVQETFDGGYILGGYSNSNATFNKTGIFKGWMDYWIVKTAADGSVQWDKTMGGTLGDYLSTVQQTKDSSYIIGGTSSSPTSATKNSPNKGLEDYWIVKLNKNGQKLWDTTYGGSGSDRLGAIKEISTGEYIAGGTSNTSRNGDKTTGTVGNTGLNDFWIIRLSETPLLKPAAKSTENIQQITSNATPIEMSKLSMQANPNPTKGPVNISYSSTEKSNISFMVYDAKGALVITKTLAAGKGNFTIDISNQQTGIYYVVMNAKNNSVTRKIIKE
ncbi:T9SS type A sorting domain-containing protein [Limnovirga soli]|uniref:T9SS type A sorting domain-containing protein n=1 Tax=Limnovirga soli TaxID=2656915 RepID=A0A8J8FI40_9BACT|nr:T9SS type A sorting domain-containing protein [Limnovirga soli]NNV56759.1 T9SS type A sorting domain-containing protein [Limnovirga soli]